MTLTTRTIISNLSDDILSQAARQRFQEVCSHAKIPLKTFCSAEISIATIDRQREGILENTEDGLTLVIAANNKDTCTLVEITAIYANDGAYELLKQKRSTLFRALSLQGSILEGIRGKNPEQTNESNQMQLPQSNNKHNTRNIRPGSPAWIKINQDAIAHLLKAIQQIPSQSQPIKLVEAAITWGKNTTEKGSPSAVKSRGHAGIKYLKEEGYIESTTDSDGYPVFTHRGKEIITNS